MRQYPVPVVKHLCDDTAKPVNEGDQITSANSAQ